MNTKHLLFFCAFATTTLITTSCRSTLYCAARDGDIQTVRSELTNNADPEGTASAANLVWQVPAGIVAIPVDAVQLVLGIATKGDYFKLDTPVFTERVFKFRGKTAMHVAEEKGNVDIMRELILAGASSSEWAKAKVLSEAARRGDTKTVSLLIEKGVNVNSFCDGDYNPIMLAIGNGHEECARVLLAHGAKFESTVKMNNQEVTCYDYAADKGQLKLYKKLGGTIAFAPANLTGKRITFIHSWKHIPIWTIAEYTKGNSYTTPPFDSKNACKDNYPQIPNSFAYKKVGAKNATLQIEGYEVGATYHMIFITPTSGIATCEGGDDGDVFSDKNVRFTIK